jgi:hypothetical protein
MAEAEPRTPTRVVHQEDALAWLAARGVLTGCSVITSLPDASELPALTRCAWEAWFVDAAERVMASVPRDGLAIFYQTDTKAEGRWVDKAQLVVRAAERTGAVLVAHRIVLRAPPGDITRGRAGYSHLVAWAHRDADDVRERARSEAMADVIPDAGATTWTRGMGVAACRAACEAVLRLTPTRAIIDPFCGHGTVLAVANAMGLDAIGVELGARRARKARTLTLAMLEGPEERTSENGEREMGECEGREQDGRSDTR